MLLMAASNVDVRRARAFLRKRSIPTRVISPRRFATAAKELGKSFADVLALIMRLRMGGQGLGPAPIGERVATMRKAA